MRPADVVGGRFEIERPAGSGGMGEVFRAKDRDTGVTVAVKVLRRGRAPEQARFEREARALAELRHPGVVRYVAHGVSPTGEAYLVMEWLEGEDLGSRLQRGKLSVDESMTIAARAAEALSEAHARGIIHRDLKPNNLFLVNGLVAQVKVLDFGMARMGGLPRMTHSGTVLGTPGYMAPEQARSSQALDPRADVFALGCVLFECLTGVPAFAGEQVMAVLAKILFEEAPRVSEMRPDVPPTLDALVAQMLAKHPSARPRDGAAVALALAAIGSARETTPAAPEVVSMTEPPVTALTRSERQVLSVVLLGSGSEAPGVPGAPGEALAAHVSPSPVTLDGPADAALQQAAAAWGGRAELLADGSIVVTITGAMIATDQAVQAARCALALRAAVPGRPVALATGRGQVAGRLPLGDMIDRAAALLAHRGGTAPMSMAAGRAAPIAIDDVTAGLLDSRFDVHRGRAGLELCEEREIVEGARTLLGKPTSYVGRERELATLEGLFAECVEAKSALPVLVTAPPGMGKSRLAQELARRLLRRHQTIPDGVTGLEPGGAPWSDIEIWLARGDSLSAGSPFGLLGQALRRTCGIHGGEALAVRQEKLRARVSRHVAPADRQWVTEFLGELLGSPLPDVGSAPLRAARQDSMLMGDQMRRAWESFLRAECSAHPVLLVLDDLQWGDLPTVQFIDTALRSLRKKPWMVLALARPEVNELFRKLWSDKGLYQLSLSELSLRASERLVRQALGERVSGETASRLAAMADGNAFYLEELIRAVAEGKGTALPETILAMVQARLNSLEGEARRILRAASVFGDVFWQGGVVALLGGSVPQAQAADWLSSLVEREVLVSRPESRFPREPEFGFRHGLLREGAYGMLTEDDRALGHRLAAEWLEARGESDPMVLAEHFERGQDPARAASHYLRAAEQALRGGDTDAALSRARRGLECGAPADLRLHLLSVVCEASLWRSGSAIGEALPYAEQVMDLAAPGSVPWIRAILTKLSWALQADDLDAFTKAFGVLRAARPLPEATAVYAWAAASVVLSLDLAGLLDAAEDNVRHLHAVVGPIAERDALARGWLYGMRGMREAYARENPWAGLRLAEQAEASFLEANHPRGARMARLVLGMNLWFLGAHRQAERELVRIAGSDEDTWFLASFRPFCLVGVLADSGSLDEARTEAQQMIEAGRARRVPGDEGRGRWALAGVLHRRGEHAAAEREVQRALELLATSPPDWIAAQATLASIMLAQGRARDALDAAEEATRGLSAVRACGFLRGASVRLVRAEALRAIGKPFPASIAIAGARAKLFENAAKIGDPELRRSFLEDVPDHARTIALARQWLGEATG